MHNSKTNQSSVAAAETSGQSPPHGLQIAAGWGPLLQTAGLNTLDALFDPSLGESLHKATLSPWRERIRLTVDVDGNATTLFLKRFRNPPLSARRDVARSQTGAATVAGLEWYWIQQLAADGVPAVQAIALGEEIRHGRETRSALLTLTVPGQSLETWSHDWLANERNAPDETPSARPPDRANLRSLIENTAALVRSFHRKGYIHRDLYLSHIFYEPDLESGGALRLIDLQRLLRFSQTPTRWTVKDLASLNYSAPTTWLSQTDRIRWLKRYLGVSKLDKDDKRLAYRILGKTMQIARHDRKTRLRSATSAAQRP